MTHITGAQFANRYYSVPLLNYYFRNYPEAMSSEKDRRQPKDTRDWHVLAQMIKTQFPAKDDWTATLDDHRVMLFNVMSGRIYNTFEKPNRETGEWESVNRSHNIQSSDNWNHLLLTEKGYYSYVRNKGKLKHLGHQIDGVPQFTAPKEFNKTGVHFRQDRIEQSSLWHLAQEWDGRPFLFIDLKDPPADVSQLRLSYDWRCVQINTRDHIAIDLSMLLPKKLPKKGA